MKRFTSDDLPGTPLADADIRLGRVLTVSTPPVGSYAWDTGVAVGRFLAELKEGRLIARRCPGCQRVLMPPRMFCEQCFRPSTQWVYVQDTGSVNTYSVSYVRWNATPLDKPVVVAVIDIDGSNGGLLHYLGEIEPDKVKIGMKVQAVWKSPQERVGSILDIRYFRPI